MFPSFGRSRCGTKAPSAGTIERVMRLCGEVVSRGYVAMLDTYKTGALGGTGRSFDWSIGAEVARCHDFMLAGGLTPGNVREAMAKARPWGVDVSSGVETEGVKDLEKIAAFAQQVRGAGQGSEVYSSASEFLKKSWSGGTRSPISSQSLRGIDEILS